MTDALLGATIAGANHTDISLDVETLIGSHMVIQANAGGGKSRTIRKVLELSTGIAQRIVIDVEDEFYTLREAAPNLILAGGDNGDCPATTANAADLARFILETGVDAVVQINDLALEVRRQFVRLFLESIIDAPRSLWHPALVVLDEADRYAPQDGSASSLSSVVALMAQGRKRGFTGILASQRNAKLNKDATGDVNNWLLGRVGQSTDRRTVADALGFKPSDPEARGLLQLKPGHFWGFGPAISPEPVLIHIGPVTTTHLMRGQTNVPTPPAPAAIREMLSKLANAAQEAQKAGSSAQGTDAPPSSAIVEAAHQRGYHEGHKAGRSEGFEVGSTHARLLAQQMVREALADFLTTPAPGLPAEAPPPPVAAPPMHSERPPATAPERRNGTEISPTSRKILEVIHDAYPLSLSFPAAAARAGVSKRSSQYRLYRRQVAESSEVTETDGRFRSLDSNNVRIVAKGPDAINLWVGRLPPSYGAMLRAMAEGGPMFKDEIAERAGISKTSSGLGAGLRELVDLELVQRHTSGVYDLTEGLKP